MKDIEYIDVKSLKGIQNERFCNTFQKLLNVPYYREKLNLHGVDISGVKSLNDITALPFTTKEDLLKCYPFSAIACEKSEIVKYHFTSGTMGKPLAVGYTKHDVKIVSECLMRLLNAAGITSGSVVQNSYGYGLFSGGLSFHEAIDNVGATVIPSSVGGDDRQIVLLKDFAVDTLCATPSYALHLANKINSEGVSGLSLKRCICGAEPWSENMKFALETLLHIEAYDVYGMTELGVGIGYNCKYREGLHICEDYFYVEIIDPLTGENITDERTGELVITSLDKEGLPLIRYKTGDLTHFILQPCKCGRMHRRIARILGRVDDMLIVKGVNVYPSEIENFVHSFAEFKVSDFEIVLKTVDSLDRLILRIEADGATSKDEKLIIKIKDMFKQKFGIMAEIDFLERLASTKPDGKKIYVRDLRSK